jgi:Domain of unknown function (DUF1844)
MDQEEKSKAFKVEDRRRFSPEGELKPEFEQEEAPAAPAQTAETPRTAAQPRASAMEASSGGAASSVGENEMTFPAFLVGISTQALVHLGEIPDPQGGPPEVNLPAAQQLIDIVGMLRDKTRGNLDKDEEGLIESILFELRMKYVERSRKS